MKDPPAKRQNDRNSVIHFFVDELAPPTLKLGGRGVEVHTQRPLVERTLPLRVAKFCRSPVCPATPVALFPVLFCLPVSRRSFVGAGLFCSPPTCPGAAMAASARMSSSEKELVLRMFHVQNQTATEIAEATGRHKSSITRLLHQSKRPRPIGRKRVWTQASLRPARVAPWTSGLRSSAIRSSTGWSRSSRNLRRKRQGSGRSP